MASGRPKTHPRRPKSAPRVLPKEPQTVYAGGKHTRVPPRNTPALRKSPRGGRAWSGPTPCGRK
eukprot:6493669-Pyramimonas_sp.AAC.1